MVRHARGVSAGVLILLGACGQAVSSPDSAPPSLGRWEALPDVALSGRGDHSAVWTGSEMIVWGGEVNPTQPLGDGGRYRPEGDTWQLIPTGNFIGRDDHAAVWTGTEMIVWGGNSYDEDLDKLGDGARYDPSTDSWEMLPAVALSPRDDPRAVWTGSEMIVWGGRDDGGQVSSGARFNPSAGTWQPVSSVAAPMPREDHTTVWTGTEMLTWGGWYGVDKLRNYQLDAARYDPVTDTWRPLSLVGSPQRREDHDAIWIGTEMLVWGGVVRSEAGREQLATGGLYDPVTDTWRTMSTIGAPEPREDDVAVWTGSELLVWGGKHDGDELGTGGRYDPATDRWAPMSLVNAPIARRNHAGVWTGDRLLMWGGKDAYDLTTTTGAAYFPD